MSKRKRSADFTEAEVRVLVTLFVKNYDLLSSKHSTTVMNTSKRAVYSRITEEVNAVGVGDRTAESIKDKWQTLRKIAKQKYAKKRKSFKEGIPDANDDWEDWETMIVNALPLDVLEGPQACMSDSDFSIVPETSSTHDPIPLPQDFKIKAEVDEPSEPPCDPPYAEEPRKEPSEKKSENEKKISASDYYAKMIRIEEEKVQLLREKNELKRWYYKKKIEVLSNSKNISSPPDSDVYE